MLSQNFIPINYKIDFDVDLEALCFSGHEKIEIEIKKPSEFLVLNSTELQIKKCLVNGSHAKFSLDEKREEMNVKLSRKMKGKIALYIEFEAPLQDSLAGFYKSTYRTGKGKKYIATTQFEPADARRAFPCFDEPLMKATFDISITTLKSLKAISNMPVRREETTGKKKKHIFETTPKMSTYLVYLGVGDFEFLKDKYTDRRTQGTSKHTDTEIRFVAVNGNSRYGKFAVECTKKFLEYFNNYFGVPYPLPKVDLIAIPDFGSGAMENWGAITFREIELLFDKKVNSSARKQRIAEVIAHELAHQWFGNLVTMKWWNDLWLNESFATWMSFKAVDSVFPEWRIWELFVDSRTTGAFYVDALKSSHPIEATVQKPHELNEIFDSISYGKGANIIRMLENFLGEEMFRKGIVKYIKDNMFSNTETDDLWKALAFVSKKDIKKTMDTWTKNTGYPVLFAHKKGKRILLSQKRFLYLAAKRKNVVWTVPLNFYSASKTFAALMSTQNFKINLKEEPIFYLVDKTKTGFYRVFYDDDSLASLKNSIGDIEPFDRWGIQSDLFAFSRAGLVKFVKYLDFIEAFIKEKNYLVCHDISEHLYKGYELSGGELKEKTRSAAIEFYTNIIERLGFDPVEGEKESDATLRSTALIALGRIGHEKTLQEARKKFENKNLHPDIRSAVYLLTALHGDKKIHNELFELYKKTNAPEEKRRLIGALASFSSTDLIRDTLNMAFSEHIKPQDLPVFLTRLFDNPNATDMTWRWVKANWDKLDKLFGKGGNIKLLERIVENFGVFYSEEYKKDIVKFFKARKHNHINKSLSQAIESIEINMQFKKINC